VKCVGKALNICADVKDGGSIRAEVVGASGLSLADSIPVTADVTDGAVTFKAKNLSELIGKRIRIRFELKNAALYSFSFSVRNTMPIR
jgi:phage tail sheath gpL-like